MAKPKDDKSIMPPEFNNPITGLVHISGEHDTGKTSFALSSGATPERSAFIDDDEKGRAVVEQLKKQGRKFGIYYDLVNDCQGMKEVEQHEYVLKIIDDIESKKDSLDVVVWDTWTRAGKMCHYYVKKYPMKFRDMYAPKSDIRRAEEGAMGHTYEGQLIARILKCVPLLIVTTHLKEKRKYITDEKSIPTGAFEPDARKSVEIESSLRVWLRPTLDGEPLGLVLKRPVKFDFTNGMKPINVLPRKMKPFTWDRIRHYWENPVGNRPPTEGEIPNELELSILDGVLTQDQKNILKLSVMEAEKEIAEEKLLSNGNGHLTDEQQAIVDKLKSEGKKPKEIAEALGMTVGELSEKGAL